MNPIFLFLFCLTIALGSGAEERQLTFSPKNHGLDGTHNFSGDDRFLVYDTRGGAGSGIGNCRSIEKVDVETGEETVLYSAQDSIHGDKAAPGMGAPYFSATENKVAFIHGPMVGDVDARGYYAKNNRNGAEVLADGSGQLTWLDLRDVARDRDTIPGAHRGGTHDHEYAPKGNRRIGLTYDDFLLPQYDRTIGYLEKHPDAPKGASHYFALLVPVVPKGTAKLGEIEKAWGDNWADEQGALRPFIGKVRGEDGYEQSLFIAEIPLDVDITTADSGSATRFPSPPIGVRVRRLTTAHADGIVRGHPPTRRITYYGGPPEGPKQIFIIPADGAENHEDPAKRPLQVTHHKNGVEGGVRWHPSGKALAYIANNGVTITYLETKGQPGKTEFLTPQGGEVTRHSLVWSHDGKTLAYNKRVPTTDADGNVRKDNAGKDFLQVFLLSTAFDGR
jgi:hypothetical protein